MSRRSRRLVVKTMVVTFGMVTALLVVVFGVVYAAVRSQVRQVVSSNFEAAQRVVSTVEERRQRELRAQAENLAENPTLKAALDTYSAETVGADPPERQQLLTTIGVELDKVAARFDADAIVLVDSKGITLTTAGRLADRWPAGRVALVERDPSEPDAPSIASMDGQTFRVVSVPLLIGDLSPIGTLYAASALDQHYADELKQLSRTDVAIVKDGIVLASTLSAESAVALAPVLPGVRSDAGTIALDGASLEYRRLASIGGASAYALASIDTLAAAALGESLESLALIAVGAVVLGLVGSVLLAHRLTKPIGQLSASVARIAGTGDLTERLATVGSSRELDALTDTFNTLLESLAGAQAKTEAAYTGAIRALAAALDARDPYTAGHSERVSALSVAIAKDLQLPSDEQDVIRLGALLHDIGKIGVRDDVLRKVGALTPEEFDEIKEHPGLGARILRPIPFLARHIPIVELHHERPDGRGYPRGLRGLEIPLAARLVHVADAFDAMTSARAYRPARPAATALHELWRGSGTEFDAEIVASITRTLSAQAPTHGEAAEPLEVVRA